MKTKRASKHFHVLGYRIRRRVVYGILAGFLIAVAGLVAVAYLRFPGSGDTPTPPAAADLAEPALSGAEPAQPESELAALLRRHREVSGLDDVTGLTLHGSYFEDGRRYEMALSMRAPELIRKNVRDPAIEIVVVSDGASGEIRVAPKRGDATVRALRADDLYWFTLVLEGAALRLAGNSGPGDYRYELLPTQESEDLRRIASTGPSGVTLTHVIDEASGLEVERSVEVRVEGTRNVLTLYLEDHRRVGAALLPHRYRLQVNGRERAETRVESVQLNPGLAPWLFALERGGEVH